MRFRRKKILLVLSCVVSTASLSVAQPAMPSSNERLPVRIGQGICATFSALQATYIASAFEIRQHQFDWLRLRIDGSLDVLEDKARKTDFIIGAVPTAQLIAVNVPFTPFLELALGVNYISDINLAERALGGNILFSPTVAGGIHINEYFVQLSLAYTFRHLSNSSLHRDNDGINFHYLTVSFGL